MEITLSVAAYAFLSLEFKQDNIKTFQAASRVTAGEKPQNFCLQKQANVYETTFFKTAKKLTVFFRIRETQTIKT